MRGWIMAVCLLFIAFCTVINLLIIYLQTGKYIKITSMHFLPHDGLDEKCTCVDCNESRDPQCGGLWKGLNFPAIQNTSSLHHFETHIIVSHCKSDLGWITNFVRGYNVSSLHIITKCGNNVTGAPTYATIESLPNVGRCDGSYVRYILSILNDSLVSDDSVIMFLKDDMSQKNMHQDGKWSDFEKMLQISSSKNGFGCGVIPGEIHRGLSSSVYHLRDELFNFTIGSYKEQQDGVPFQSLYKNLGSFVLDVLHDAAKSSYIVPVCYGGVFAATVKNIKKVNRSVWEAADEALRRGDNIAEGHYMERSWALLLSTPLEHYQTEGIITHASTEHQHLPLPPHYRGLMVSTTNTSESLPGFLSWLPPILGLQL